MALKDTYLWFEEKYYGILDKVDAFVPVNKLVDKIDQVVPSFPLVLASVFVLFALLFLFFTGAFAPQTATLTIIVIDEENKRLENVSVFASSADGLFSSDKKTNDDGLVVFEGITVGTAIDLIVEKNEFERKESSIEVDLREKEFKVTLEKIIIPPTPHFIEFVNPQDLKLEGIEIDVHLECTNSSARLLQKDFTINNGELEVIPPNDCGFLTASATSIGFLELNEVLDLPAKTLEFLAAPLPKGTIRITVKDLQTNQSLENIKISVFGEEGEPSTTPFYTRSGEALIDLVPGNYTASVQDPSGNYGLKEISFLIEQNKTNSQTVELSKRLAATLNISVVDKATGQKVSGAKVSLKKNNKLILEETILPNEQQAVFALSEKGVYTYIAGHDDYLSGVEKQIDLSSALPESVFDLEFELEKCNPQNCGTLKVRVVDEEEKPIENAKVFLYNADTNTIASEFGERTTDSNGFVENYTNLGETRVYAYAYKYPSSGKSIKVTVNPLEENELEVRLLIGNGEVFVQAVNEAGGIIPFSLADVLNSSGQIVGTISLDEEGKGSLTTKADKEVFVKVRKEGFNKFVSVKKQVVRNSRIEFKAVLTQGLANDVIRAEFLGLFDESGNNLITQTIEAGKNYLARFNLIVPSQKNYSEVLLHVRTGASTTLDADKVFIRKANAPQASVYGGLTFNPPTSSQLDLSQSFSQNVKWVNLVLNSPQAGTYSIEVDLRVKPETVPGTELPISFRAQAITPSGVERDPIDEVLGSNLETGSRHALYATSQRQVFFEGAQKTCDENFCFGERLVDPREGIVLVPPYNLRVFDDYEYSFTITNNSGTLHDNADLRIKNSLDGIIVDNALSIEDYEITNADSVKFTSTEPLFGLVNPLSLGYFSTFSSVEGQMTLQAKELGLTNLELKIISGSPAGVEIFNQSTQFDVLELDKVKLNVEPEKLIAFKPITLKVTVEFEGGQDDGMVVENARLVFTRIDPNNFETSFDVLTNTNGEAEFILCGQAGCSPGTKVIIEAQKEGIKSQQIEFEISDAVVEFEPPELEFNLNITNILSESKTIDVTNLIPETVKLSRFVLRGNFEGLLDTETMNAYLQQFEDQVNIDFEDSQEFSVLVELNDNARLLEEPVKARGSLLVDVKDLSESATWPMKEIPITVNVDLAQPPADEQCLIVSSPEWDDSVLETSSIKQFTLVNNCITEQGALMDLKNLQATVNWSSDEAGQIVLSVQNPSTGESSTQVLQTGISTIVLESLKGREELIMTLTFVPKPSKVGEEAVFNVKFQAELLTNTGKSFVDADKEVAAQLLIINLSSCVKANPSFGQIINFKNENEGTFSVSTSDCGEIPIDLRFCYNDSGCSGGTEEGSIGVSPRSFADLRAEEKEVLVFRESIPGIYGVKVEARPRGGGWRQVGEVLVLFEPDEGSNFMLSKYDFVAIGSGSRDTAVLTNAPLSEDAIVDASACDWKLASDDKKFFNFAGAGIGAAVGGLLGAKPAIEAAKVASQAVSLPKSGVSAEAVKSVGQAEIDTGAALMPATTAQEGVTSTTMEVTAIPECAGASTTALEAAKAAMAKANQSAALASGDIGLAQGHAATAAATATAAQTTAGAGAGPTAAGASTAAAGELTSAGTAMGEATRATGTACTGIGSAYTEIGTVQTQLSMHGSLAASEAATWQTACANGVPGACENAQLCTTSASASSAAQAALSNSAALLTTAQTACQKALASQGLATGGLTTASGAMSSLGAQQAAMSSSFNTGRFFALEGLFAGLGFVGGGLLGGLLDEDECKERHQFPLSDYIINLKSDGISVDVDKQGISGSWSTDDAHVFGDYEYQEVGVVFRNTGLEEPKPVYRVADFRAIKHTHSPITIVPKGSSNFSPFNVPDAATEIYSQQFHLRFKTGETEDPIPSLGEGMQACVSGVHVGRTGEGSIPKIKFDWNWKTFSQNSCDVSNEDFVYCDATQFNMALNYRLDALREFLDKNREKLECPENEGDSFSAELTDGFAEEIQNGDLPSFGTSQGVSIASYSYATGSNFLSVSVLIANDSESQQSATVKVQLQPPAGVNLAQDECDIEYTSIPTNGTQTKSCRFENLPQNAEDYSANVQISESSAPIEDQEFEFNATIESAITCWMPTSTELYDGRPALDYYIDGIEQQITWTSRVPNRQALNDLLVFDAYLIKDGYSEDFKGDFVKYSNEVAFFDTPTFFNKLGSGQNGEYGFDEYYLRDRISFEKKFAQGINELSRGGIYRVELKIDFGGFWQFFDQQGNPQSNIKVLFSLLKEPEENHVFYHLPLDGLVGLQTNNIFDRRGYGTGFVNSDPDKIVNLNSQEKGFKTFESSNTSNAFVRTNVEYVDNFFELNSNPVNRGSVLSIENTGMQTSLKFSPSLATPVVMKIHGREREDSFGAYYSLLETESKTNVGNVMNYWSGLGQCLDFSGEHVKEAFDEKTDRLAQPDDRFVNWENTYTVQWRDSLKNGDVYLATIFYSHPFRAAELKAEGPLSDLEFFSPDVGPATLVPLAGISSMPFNNNSSQVASIDDVFELLKQGVLCETSTGNKVSYWWNPKNLFEFEGQANCLNCEGKRSILKEEQALMAGRTCIGTN